MRACAGASGDARLGSERTYGSAARCSSCDREDGSLDTWVQPLPAVCAIARQALEYVYVWLPFLSLTFLFFNYFF